VQSQYLEACVEQQPNATLAELNTKLWVVYRVNVDDATISRELIRQGFRCKTVRILRPNCFLLAHCCQILRAPIEHNKVVRNAYQVFVGANYCAK
jgi:hypothetical protein